MIPLPSLEPPISLHLSLELPSSPIPLILAQRLMSLLPNLEPPSSIRLSLESLTFLCHSQETPSSIHIGLEPLSFLYHSRLPKQAISFCRSLDPPKSLCPSLKSLISLHSSLRTPFVPAWSHRTPSLA